MLGLVDLPFINHGGVARSELQVTRNGHIRGA